jgi:hypothetical protein
LASACLTRAIPAFGPETLSIIELKGAVDIPDDGGGGGGSRGSDIYSNLLFVFGTKASKRAELQTISAATQHLGQRIRLSHMASRIHTLKYVTLFTKHLTSY